MFSVRAVFQRSVVVGRVLARKGFSTVPQSNGPKEMSPVFLGVAAIAVSAAGYLV
ncbi:MAG: hypothetical protein JSS07_12650 [Proteobacteria bacterium]|nr:hypothetical protein [Pseudomonadota bacterium]